MNSETHHDLMSETSLTNTQYSIALMVFLIAYTVFEVLSNTFLKRFGPAKWFALLLCCWGAISMCLGATQNYAGLTAARFLLGAFEAGLAPGLAYYVSFWYRADERSIRLAFIYSTATLAGAFGMCLFPIWCAYANQEGGLIAYGISHLNQAAGLAGWR
jgi:MFS family permease